VTRLGSDCNCNMSGGNWQGSGMAHVYYCVEIRHQKVSDDGDFNWDLSQYSSLREGNTLY